MMTYTAIVTENMHQRKFKGCTTFPDGITLPSWEYVPWQLIRMNTCGITISLLKNQLDF